MTAEQLGTWTWAEWLPVILLASTVCASAVCFAIAAVCRAKEAADREQAYQERLVVRAARAREDAAWRTVWPPEGTRLAEAA